MAQDSFCMQNIGIAILGAVDPVLFHFVWSLQVD